MRKLTITENDQGLRIDFEPAVMKYFEVIGLLYWALEVARLNASPTLLEEEVHNAEETAGV